MKNIIFAGIFIVLSGFLQADLGRVVNGRYCHPEVTFTEDRGCKASVEEFYAKYDNVMVGFVSNQDVWGYEIAFINSKMFRRGFGYFTFPPILEIKGFDFKFGECYIKIPGFIREYPLVKSSHKGVTILQQEKLSTEKLDLLVATWVKSKLFWQKDGDKVVPPIFVVWDGGGNCYSDSIRRRMVISSNYLNTPNVAMMVIFHELSHFWDRAYGFSTNSKWILWYYRVYGVSNLKIAESEYFGLAEKNLGHPFTNEREGFASLASTLLADSPRVSGEERKILEAGWEVMTEIVGNQNLSARISELRAKK